MGDLGFWIEECFSTRRLEIGGTGRIYVGFPWSMGRFEGLKSRRDLGVRSVELAGENILRYSGTGTSYYCKLNWQGD